MSDLITDGCESPCGCWDLNTGPPEEQSVLLTTEPSLQPQNLTFKEKHIYLKWKGPVELFCVYFVFRDRVSLCSPGCPETHSVDQAGLKTQTSAASASLLLGLKACVTPPGFLSGFACVSA